LAITCALEHFTAILAEQMLTEPDIYNGFDASMQKLWLWHAVEESEHKAVAFDVYQEMVGDYRLRVRAMAITTFFFIMHTTWFQARLLKADGKLFDVRMWLKGLDRMWGRKGHFRKLIPSYLQYYRRDFHPWQHDNRAELAKWITALQLDHIPAHAKQAVTNAAITSHITAATAAPAEASPAPVKPAPAPRARKPAVAKAATAVKAATPEATSNAKPSPSAKPKPKTIQPKSLDKPRQKSGGTTTS
jgi:hypothetical protein